MEKADFDEILYEINDLNIKDNLKKELSIFNEKMKENLEKRCKFNFDIIIDNTCIDDINILLEYIINIIQRYGLYSDFIKYRDDTDDLDGITNSIIVVDDFNVFKENILNGWNSQRNFNDFFVRARLNNNMIILTCPNNIDKHLKSINSSFFNVEACIRLNGSIENKDLYNELMTRYKKNNIKCNLSYTSFKKIINVLDNDYYVKHFDIVDYIYDYSVKKMILNNDEIVNIKTFNKLLNSLEDKKKSRKCIKKNDDIENLVGLGNVKGELNSLYNYLEFSKKNNLNNKDMYLNMFFLGNPGTGKTTVARMYAKKLFALGLIDSSKVVEITPNDLMGRYVGQTKDAVRKILDEAAGGVLFIDEAYLINDDVKNGIPYMNEALIELLKYLENPKNVVIFAGYSDKMKDLYDNNPGIKSRIYKEIVFDDYSSLELFQILELGLQDSGLKIDVKSKKRIINYIDNIKNDVNFGNARTIKNLSQKMIMNHANRKLENDNLLIDFNDLPKMENVNMLKMGFGVYDN